jgi:predicted O-methyltransferase YrrM
MLYFLCRALGCEKVLEVGHAEGYSSFYLASAVKDNAQRFQMKGNMYYGIDIVQTEKVQEALTSRGLPHTIINLDSMKLTPETFGTQFDLIFQDGCHDEEHVVHEFNTMWPALKPGGYWIAHDSAGPAEEGWHRIMKERRYQFDALRFLCVYGLGVIHKTEGLDPEKRYWTP